MNYFHQKYVIVLILLSAVGSALAQFNGGESGGHSNLRLSNVSCTVLNNNPFTGGGADGHANNRLVNVVCSVTNINPFTGGESDGHSNQRLNHVTCAVINVNPYSGGEADGHANQRLTNMNCPVINANPFAGGEADGHSNINLTNNPLCLPLPMELLSFLAFPSGKNVLVQWTTTTEVNNDYFTVERSRDAVLFVKVADVNGAGTSASNLSYELIDTSPYEGNGYYRLKQTDFNGDFVYSNIIPVELSNGYVFGAQVYPSPFGTALTLEVPGSHGPVSYEVWNPLGVLVYTGVLEQRTSITTSSFSSGLYVVRFSDGVHVVTRSAVKE